MAILHHSIDMAVIARAAPSEAGELDKNDDPSSVLPANCLVSESVRHVDRIRKARVDLARSSLNSSAA